MKKYILTNQMKNEYFQENEKKTIEITRKMTLFDDESTKMIIVFIYEGNGIKNTA